jgi:hypothetical protein
MQATSVKASCAGQHRVRTSHVHSESRAHLALAVVRESVAVDVAEHDEAVADGDSLRPAAASHPVSRVDPLPFEGLSIDSSLLRALEAPHTVWSEVESPDREGRLARRRNDVEAVDNEETADDGSGGEAESRRNGKRRIEDWSEGGGREWFGGECGRDQVELAADAVSAVKSISALS